MTPSTAPRWPVRYLLFIGGLGGLLYGIDIGIIAGALPYLEATASHAWQLSSQQLGFVVAAVLLGSVLSSLFAGMIADLIGRRGAMLLAGLLFTASIPIMALASGYTPLLLGRLLQGISGGLIGVVIPLYLAEVLSPERRGRGAAMFQLLLTIGLVLAALIGLYHAHAVDAAAEAVRSLPLAQQAQELFTVKDHAWRTIFWTCLAPGLLFCAGIFWLSESPRWLVRRGRIDEARRSLQRVLPAADVEPTLAQIQAPESSSNHSKRDPLLSRRYVVPFLLACVVLACTQATGINSVLAYAVNILNQAGLSGSVANGADVAIKLLNAVMTVVALLLVDRKGRKFLLMLGSGGICVALLAAATLFFQAERGRADVQPQLQAAVSGDGLQLVLDDAQWQRLSNGIDSQGRPMQLTVSYAYGDFTNVRALRSDNLIDRELRIERAGTVQPDSVIGAFFRKLHLNPFADPASAAHAAAHRAGAHRPGAAAGTRLGRGRLHPGVRRVLRGRPRRVRVAGAVGADAEPHPFQWHEHRAADQPVRVDHHRRHLPAHGGPLRLRQHVRVLGGVHLRVLPGSRVLAAGDQGQVAGGDRGTVRPVAVDLGRPPRATRWCWRARH